VGGPAVPEMMRRGYDKRLSVGAAASGGTLGILIPPSIAMIIFGIINEVSIGQLYIAGIIPGLMMALLLSLAIAAAVRLRPQLAPPVGPVTWSERAAALGRIWPFLALVIAMIVPIYAGLATPTESAAIGAAGALAYGAATKTLSRQLLGHALLRTVQTTAMSMFLLIGGFMLAFVLSSLRIPQTISRLIVSMEIAPWMVIVAISVLFLILGFCLDPTSELVLMSPVVFPVVVELGYDPIWFGIIMTINTEIANIMPPDGINLLVLRSVVPEGVTMDDIILGSIPFVLVLLLGMGILMVFPEIALWLPRQMK
jgi:C4-dicarboxylate transporter DctM subunit